MLSQFAAQSTTNFRGASKSYPAIAENDFLSEWL